MTAIQSSFDQFLTDCANDSINGYPRPIVDVRPPGDWNATSAEAAEAIKPIQGAQQLAVLDYLREHSPASDETIAAMLGMSPSSQRPRRIELLRAGLIEPAGFGVTRSGRRCQLWKVA